MDQKVHLRTELADVSFEDLQKIEEKIGSKLYNEALFDSDETKSHRRKKKNDEKKHDSQRMLPPRKKQREKPVEMSSKRPYQKPRNIMNASKRVHRDPRFDDLSGTFDEEQFEQDYSFVKDIQKDEQKSVESALKNCEDEEKSARLSKLLYRMKQKDIAQKKKETRRNIDNRLKAQETELVKQGKKPFFLKQSDKKVLELAEHYKELKKSGKLEKYMTKKRKKNVAKERRQMPNNT